MPLPSKDMMRMDTEKDMQNRWAKGYTKRQAHMMGPDQQGYYEDLAAAANTTPIAPVIVKLRDESVKRLYDDLQNFREDRYKIVNNENFVKVH
jgi:dimethylaniline monooxygenase (N-oxide forming)